MKYLCRRAFVKFVGWAVLSCPTETLCLPTRAIAASDSQNSLIFELLGKKEPALHGKNYRLREKVAKAFESMSKAARKDGVTLYPSSTYRSFERQKGIWNRKFSQLTSRGMDANAAVNEIVRYSSIPGTSRHHWATEIDITGQLSKVKGDRLLEKHFQKGGAYADVYQWLLKNAKSYGFYEVYTKDSNRTGYSYEPWHWSYADLSIPYLQEYLKIDLCGVLKDKTLKGSECFTKEFIDRFTKQWILGINKTLIPG